VLRHDVQIKSSAMKLSRISTSPHALLLGALLAASSLQGCQTTVGGQTLPSANYLRDDVQFFPAGPEDKLFYQRQAIEQYNAGRIGADDLAQPGGVQPPPPPAPAP
jgi:hypothetical protein